MTDLHVVGAGGHAKVIVALAEAAGYRIAGVYDDRPLPLPGVLGYEVKGPVDQLERRHGTVAVLAVGSNAARQALAARLPNVTWATLVHPAAWMAPTVKVGEGTVVMAGAVIQPDAVLGRHVIVNTGASVDHDVQVGDFVHIAPGSTLAGNVTLDEGAFLGVGTRVIPGMRVGAWATVGAGAVVIRPVPHGATAIGVPARVLTC